MITIKSHREIELMRMAGKIVSDTFKEIAKYLKPGITTNEINEIADQYIRSQGAIPSFLNYEGYPKSVCVSVNDEVVHGIPGSRILRDGDIVSLDMGTIYKGYQGDSAKTFAVGQISPEAQKLIDVTRQCFYEGIKFAKPGYRLHDISYAIQKYAEDHGYSVVRELTGHGIGTEMHEDPSIPNYGKPGTGVRLQKGMTLAIEPMIVMGRRNIRVLDDDWTVVTEDGSLAAHYEHTIAITDTEPQILTL